MLSLKKMFAVATLGLASTQMVEAMQLALRPVPAPPVGAPFAPDRYPPEGIGSYNGKYQGPGGRIYHIEEDVGQGYKPWPEPRGDGPITKVGRIIGPIWLAFRGRK